MVLKQLLFGNIRLPQIALGDIHAIRYGLQFLQMLLRLDNSVASRLSMM
jgi:hypothetical protein